jgi:hypothetical protein
MMRKIQRLAPWAFAIGLLTWSGYIIAQDQGKPAPAKEKAARAKPTAETAKPEPAAAKKATSAPAENKPAPAADKPVAEKPAAKEAEKPAPAKSTAAAPAKKSAAASALAQKIRAAKFDTRAGERRAAARAKFVDAVAKLDRYLSGPRQPHGAAWKAYLEFDRLQAAAKNADDHDPAVLAESLSLLNGGYNGLELAPFRTTAAALADFIAASGAAKDATEQDYSKAVDALAAAVEAGGDNPSSAEAVAIGNGVAWLEAHGQSPELVATIATQYSQPNLFVDVSEAIIRDGLGDPVDEVAPVHDCILGTSISGCGRTIGNVQVDFVESSERAEIRTAFAGTNYSNTVGHNRSALIYSRGTTNLWGHKTLYIDDGGFKSSAGSARATVNSQITGIGSTKKGLMGAIVRKVAAKKAPQQKPQAQVIAARHAEQRLSRQLDNTAGEALKRSNADYLTRLRHPLERYDAMPRVLKFSTTNDSLRLRALQDAYGRLAAPSQAPELGGDAGIVVRFHQSLVDNTAQQMFAGRTYDRPRLVELLDQFGLEAPPENEDETPFTITFAENEPIGLGIDDGRVSITIRGRKFTSDGKPYDGMYITAHYAVATDGEHVRLTREDDLEIHPPGFRPGVDKLALSQTTFKRILIRKFDKLLPKEYVGQGIAFGGGLSKVGSLVVSRLKADDGWLAVGLDRKPPQPKTVTLFAPPPVPLADLD